MMILWPECFLSTEKSNKMLVIDKNLETMFANFYQRIFLSISTNTESE